MERDLEKADPAGKDKLYTDLRSLLQNVPANDKNVILGDSKARVGRDSKVYLENMALETAMTVYHCLQTEKQIKNYLDASSIKTQAHDRLYPCA